MKTFFAIIVLIILALIIGFFVRKAPVSEAPLTAMETTNTEVSSQVTSDEQKKLSATESTFTWSGKKTIIKDYVDTGTVMMRDGFVTVDQGTVTGGKLVIDMTSIAATTTGGGSGQDKLSGHLKSADFFDAALHPTAEIMVNRIADGIAYGNLTIKGITKSVEFPVSVKDNGGQYEISGTLSVNRTWFDVKFGSKAFFKDLVDKMVIDDMFTIEFKLVTE
jgi:hypothetical protein